MDWVIIKRGRLGENEGRDFCNEVEVQPCFLVSFNKPPAACKWLIHDMALPPGGGGGAGGEGGDGGSACIKRGAGLSVNAIPPCGAIQLPLAHLLGEKAEDKEADFEMQPMTRKGEQPVQISSPA